MPNNSWVAKWNNLEGMKPGIYAINILAEMQYDVEDNYHQQTKNNRRKQRTVNDQMWEDDYYDDEVWINWSLIKVSV